ncbi:glycosyltransferase [Lactobacillus gallinarum]|uniref:glycosyltransferase n=1 Tax=Lactobacillus gallinarum TaxID=52242 RepID=UPI0024B1D2A3|nr:glycosyltransferase [Lactobacillus gallinarum]
MKILLINTVPLEKNGISTFILNSAMILSERGIHVTILAHNLVDTALKIKLEQNNIQLKQITDRKRHPLSYFNELKNFLRKERFDIVHVNGNSTTMAIELWAAKLSKVKLRIAHSHNTTTQHPVINKILRPFFEFSVNGRLACNKAAGKWLFGSKTFMVIPNGINLPKYKFDVNKRNEIRKELGINNKEILLGHVGEFNYQKNQIFLIDLLKKLPSKYKLVLIGQGNVLEDLKDRATQNNLKRRIIFTGAIDNVQDYLNAIDIFLLPSRYEGQPFVLVEATASGLDCIVSDKVSHENDIVNNMNFISLKDRKQWEFRIKQYSTNKREKRSSDNIKILTQQGYNAYKNIDKLINYYKGY